MLKRPLYPYLLSLYFVFFVFAENLGEVYLGQLIGPVLAAILVTGVLVLALSLTFRSAGNGAFSAAALLFLLFAHNGMAALLRSSVSLRPTITLAIEIVLLACLVIFAVRAVTDWSKVNRILNFTFGTLLVITIARVGVYGLTDPRGLSAPELTGASVATEQGGVKQGPRPDVYYILVDAYAREDVLEDYYGYDNSDFTGFLEDKGFRVANKSVGNYPFTYLVVNSVMNRDYVADESGFKDTPNGQSFGLKKREPNNKVATQFGNLGYRIVTIRSWGTHIVMANADDLELFNSWIAHDEFAIALIDTTLLATVFTNLTNDLFSLRDRVDFALDAVSDQVTAPGPKFVLAHIMAPHHPFFYDRDGNTPEDSGGGFGQADHLADDIRMYGDQVHYLNKRLRKMINDILEKSAAPPIIILQGDHGLRMTRYYRGDREPSRQIDGSCPRELYANLNAIYLPDSEAADRIYDSMSPVNTFRLISDAYFGSELGMIADRTYFPLSDEKELNFKLIDITDSNESCSEEWEERFRNAKPR